MRKIILPVLLFLFISAIFFAPFYLFSSKALVTPEFRGGDIVNMHYPYRYFAKMELMKGSIPFWSSYTANGFPIFAQSEIGLLNPINFVSLYFLDVFDALIVQAILTFTIMLCSLYYLGRVLKLNNLSSIFLAVTFSFSAYNIFSLIHFPHVQAVSAIPLIFGLVLNILRRGLLNQYFFLLIALVYQLLNGHYQNFYITSLFIAVFLFIYYLLKRKQEEASQIAKRSLFVFLTIILSVLISALQLLPSVFLVLESARFSSAFTVQFNHLTFNPKDILTILNPFIFGNPREGNYPYYFAIPPWDGTLYIGIIPLVFLLFFFKFFNYFKNHKDLIKVLILSSVFFFLLAWEQSSPLYFLFSLPPFSFFRFNSRFLVIIILVLAVFSAFGFSYFTDKILLVKNKKIRLLSTLLSVLMILILFLEQMFLTYTYHNLVDKSTFLSRPKLMSYIKPKDKILTYGAHEIINEALQRRGFSKDRSLYFDITKNSLAADFNLFYDVKSMNNSISGVNLARIDILLSKFYPALFTDLKQYEELEGNFLYITGLTHILSFKKIKSVYLSLVDYVNVREELPLSLYKVVKPSSYVEGITRAARIETLEEFLHYMANEKLEDIALLEADFPQSLLEKLNQSQSGIKPSIKISEITNNRILVKVKSNNDFLLINRENYYPEWTVLIDGKKTTLYKANFISRAVWVPKGEHVVTFLYSPAFFKTGAFISAAAFLLAITLFIWRLKILKR